jgi:uncharacterized protein with von Willebrand factor type A (vWA) domain
MTAPSVPIDSITAFGHYLRGNGYAVGIAEQAALVQTALALTPKQYRRLEACWRSVVCANRDQWQRYPELFNLYWRGASARGGTRVRGERRRGRSLRDAVADMHASMPGAGASSPRAAPGLSDTRPDSDPSISEGHAQGGASAIDPLTRRGIEHWRPEDSEHLRALAESVAKKVRRQLARRVRLANRGRVLDLRRTLRRSLKYGGLPFAPAWQRKRRELPRVFMLVDVSRSMEMYAQLFLRVARAFCEVLDARVFVFHTRLAEVTPLLRRTSGRVQEKINTISFGFGGGTRIASSLQEFAGVHARAALSRRSMVLICSDGYDTDPPDALRASLAHIRRRGARIFWLHPTHAAALSTALQEAQSLVTAFAPAHDLESLQRLPALIH